MMLEECSCTLGKVHKLLGEKVRRLSVLEKCLVGMSDIMHWLFAELVCELLPRILQFAELKSTNQHTSLCYACV